MNSRVVERSLLWIDKTQSIGGENGVIQTRTYARFSVVFGTEIFSALKTSYQPPDDSSLI